MALRARQVASGHEIARALKGNRRRQTSKVRKASRPSYLTLLCRAHALPEPDCEVRFHPERLWRFDYAWPLHRVALEREGGIWVQGRHSRGVGMEADMVKYAEATLLGWRVFRASPQQIQDGTVLVWLQRALKVKT
jgi:hypothetical protein